MNILAFDTSTKMLTVASSNGQGLAADVNFRGAFQHSENLFHLIGSVLTSLKQSLKEVDAYAIGLGPGSFTGLRIGFSVLKGFLAVHPKPVYGFSSLDLIAQGVAPAKGKLAVLLNARRERVYAAFYTPSRDGWQRNSGEDRVLTLEQLLKCRGLTLLAGDALDAYGNEIRKKMPKAVFIGEDFWYPRADHLVKRVLSGAAQLKPLTPPALNPRYLRLSEPEEKVLGKALGVRGSK